MNDFLHRLHACVAVLGFYCWDKTQQAKATLVGKYLLNVPIPGHNPLRESRQKLKGEIWIQNQSKSPKG